jgi:hypothetical protein
MNMPSKIKKLGVAGFIFFTVKGLLWLAIPAVVVAYKGCTGAE